MGGNTGDEEKAQLNALRYVPVVLVLVLVVLLVVVVVVGGDRVPFFYCNKNCTHMKPNDI